MRRKMVMAMMLAAVMTVTAAGCGNGSKSEAASKDTAAGSDAAAKTSDAGAESSDGNTGEMQEISIMHKLSGNEKYIEGDDINNNVWTRYYQDEFGIKLNYTIAAAGDDYTQKLTMAIASNDLPDIIELPAKEFQELAQAGMLADLTDVYEKEGSQLLKTALESDGGTQLSSAKIDGKLYAIPQPASSDSTCDLLWVRTDWLKNLGLEAPKNMEELLAVAKAFRYDDPDQNGKDDTWGIGFQKDINKADGASPGSYEGFFAAYDAYVRAWLPDESGQIAYTGIRPGVKDALTELSQMYKDGLIDPEFGVKDVVKLSEDIASGKVGMFFGNEGTPWGAAKSCIEKNPSADWQCFPIVSATDKTAEPISYIRLNRYYGVNKNCKNPEAVIKLANAFQDKINSIDSTEETLNTYGVDPKTGINFAEYPAAALDPAVQKCNTYYAEIKDALEGKIKPEEMHPEAKRYYETIKAYRDGGSDKSKNSLGWNYDKFIGPEGSWNTIINVYKADNILKESVFFGALTPTMGTKLASLDKLQSETYVNIIMGTQAPDTFDKFVSDWKSLGGDEITKEVNDWYKTTFAK